MDGEGRLNAHFIADDRALASRNFRTVRHPINVSQINPEATPILSPHRSGHSASSVTLIDPPPAGTSISISPSGSEGPNGRILPLSFAVHPGK